MVQRCEARCISVDHGVYKAGRVHTHHLSVACSERENQHSSLNTAPHGRSTLVRRHVPGAGAWYNAVKPRQNGVGPAICLSVAIGTSGNGGNTGTTERSTAFRDENSPDVRAVLACDGSGVHLLEGLVVGLSVGAALAHEPEPEPGLPAVTKDTLAQAYSARAPIRDSLMRSRGGPAG